MSATATTKGKPQRKQLADELDRLDGLIDLLSEGLPAAVADACRDGARLAMKDAIIEIMSNPELRALLAPSRIDPTWEGHTTRPEPKSVPEEPKVPSIWSRLKAKVAAARAAVVGAVQKAKEAVKSRWTAARSVLTTIGTMAGEALPVRRILLVGLGLGVAVGLVTLTLPDVAAAVVSAVSTTISVVAVQVGGWLKRAAGRYGLVA